jgi:arylesterase / paraoxonase
MSGLPADLELRPLGIAFDAPSSTLFLTNHRRHGPRIEVFRLDLHAFTATYTRSITHPLLHGPNSIAVVDSQTLLVTNDHYFEIQHHPWAAQLETYLAPPLATVVEVHISDEQVEASVVAHLPFANGIAILNSTYLAVASSSQAAVQLYEYSQNKDGHLTLTSRMKMPVPFFPDNLSVSVPDGALLIAGHPHVGSLGAFADSRPVCNYDPPESELARCREIEEAASSWVSEWTEKGGLRHVFAGTEFPTSSTALRDGKTGIVMGLYAKGIMVWKE